MAKGYLRQHGISWYSSIPVPRGVRHLFKNKAGKPLLYVVQSLGESNSAAKVAVARLRADLMPLFAAAPAMTPEAIEAELAAIKERNQQQDGTPKWFSDWIE